MKNIEIEFPGVKALKGVDFTVHTGTIHALIGANGAGKSTLMKVLVGAYDHFTGAIHLDGQPVNIRTPRDAKEHGIEIVYQEVDTALIPYLSVAENIMIDIMVNKMKNKHFIQWDKIYKDAKKVLDRINVSIDTQLLAQDLTLAQKQMVLIARALVEQQKFLVLDEPTAPLSQTETEELFRIVRDLAYNHNVGIIFISHRLPEIFELCEIVTIVRDGKIVAEHKVAETNQTEVINEMLGHRFEETFPKTITEIKDKLFEARNISTNDHEVNDASLYVRAGEIIGIAGLVGAGKTELSKALFGALPLAKGEIFIKNEKAAIKNPRTAVKSGLALVPEERRKEGVFVEEPVYANLSASHLSAFANPMGFLLWYKEHKHAEKMVETLSIKTPSVYQKVAFLSGGNQQKVAVGKWLSTNADIFIFDEPTKGVDVGAKHEIFELIGNLAKNGKAIIYASCELPEILGISDRTYVMYDRKIVKELVTAETNEAEILYYSAGGK